MFRQGGYCFADAALSARRQAGESCGAGQQLPPKRCEYKRVSVYLPAGNCADSMLTRGAIGWQADGLSSAVDPVEALVSIEAASFRDSRVQSSGYVQVVFYGWLALSEEHCCVTACLF